MRAAVFLAVVFLGACSGRSTKNGEPSSDAGNGGTGTSGSSGATNGGTSGSATGGAPAGGIAGTSTTGGVSTTGGAPTTGGVAGVGGTAGIGGTGTSGTGGAAGEGGAADCEGPAPGGCPLTPCSSGQTCALSSGVCIPSHCDCRNGRWECSMDCGGGRCVDDSPCTSPDPSGCGSDDECPMGEFCGPTNLAVCIPRLCACSAASNTWTCAEMCTGGVCQRPSCPENCMPQAGAFCGADQITWVCISGPFPIEEFGNAGCTDAGTQVPRYCCPTTFKPECQ